LWYVQLTIVVFPFLCNIDMLLTYVLCLQVARGDMTGEDGCAKCTFSTKAFPCTSEPSGGVFLCTHFSTLLNNLNGSIDRTRWN
jgi:hypothetical protein